MTTQRHRKRATTIPKPSLDDLVNTLSGTMMNAREISVYMRVSASCAQKYVRSLRDDGLVMIDHLKSTQKNGNEVPFYRAMTAAETAEYKARQSAGCVDRSERGGRREVAAERPHAVQRDSLVSAFFGAGLRAQ